MTWRTIPQPLYVFVHYVFVCVLEFTFSLWQLQEKCKEQQQPLYMAFMDLPRVTPPVCKGGINHNNIGEWD